MEIVYADPRIVVAVKPAGVLSTDEPGGMPQLLRQELGTPCIRTVHRRDAAVSGLMVYARSAKAASLLSEQLRSRTFGKEYLAVVHGVPEGGVMTDLLGRDPVRRRTYVAAEPGKNACRSVRRGRRCAGTFRPARVYISYTWVPSCLLFLIAAAQRCACQTRDSGGLHGAVDFFAALGLQKWLERVQKIFLPAVELARLLQKLAKRLLPVVRRRSFLLWRRRMRNGRLGRRGRCLLRGGRRKAQRLRQREDFLHLLRVLQHCADGLFEGKFTHACSLIFAMSACASLDSSMGLTRLLASSASPFLSACAA